MEEIKQLVEAVANLPNIALWLAFFLLVYKVTVVGSIYGVIRFCTQKIHDVFVAKKTREVEYKEIRPMIDGMCIRTETDKLIAQLYRIRGKGVNIPTEYIHQQSVDWLREAIDDKIEKDNLAKVYKAA
jgi:hypothetical protein